MKYIPTIIVIAVLGIVVASTISSEKREVTTKKVLETQTSDAAGVTVAVTPKEISTSIQTWDFEVSLNTHSVELNEDLVSEAILIDQNANIYKPIAWEGDSPGGHHREGVLRFHVISPLPTFVELKIVAGGAERSFKWILK